MEADWKAWRAGFTACNTNAFFLSTSVGLVHEKVLAAQGGWVERVAREGAMLDQAGFTAIEAAREVCAQFINAQSSADVAFTPNTSYGMSLLALALKDAGAGGNVVMPEDEFPTSALPWHHLGYQVRMVPSVAGRISAEALLAEVDSDTAAVVCSAVQSNLGWRVDLNALGRGCEQKGLPLLVNATQGVGHVPLDVQRWPCAALMAGSHKWLGAGFSGALFYASPTLRERLRWPVMGWRAAEDIWALRNDSSVKPTKDARAVEIGTANLPGIVAIQSACELMNTVGMTEIIRRNIALSDILINKLADLPVVVTTARDKEPDLWKTGNSGTVSFEAPHAEEIQQLLKSDRVYLSVRSGRLRAGLHAFNNEDDIDRLVEGLGRHIQALGA